MLHAITNRLIQWGYQKSKKTSRVNLYEYLTNAINTYQCDQGKSLNIGAGGEIAKVLNSNGISPLTIDIDEQRGPDLIANVEDLSAFEDNSFDFVFLMEVLEHVRDPFTAAKEITRVLVPGGVLIGSTPFILGIHDSPHDYYRYTKFGLKNVFEGLESLELVPRNSLFAAAEVLPLRLFVVGSESEKSKMAWRLPLLLLSSFLLRICGIGVENDDATTGYFFTFQKPVLSIQENDG